MSREYTNLLNDEMTQSYLELSANVKCKIHQTLNKYYLKKKEKFVCEYDGFDDDGPDSFMHMPQILEQYHDEIINLQTHPEYFEQSEVNLKIPNFSKNGKRLNLDISKFNYEYENFMQDTFYKIINFIKANNSLVDIKDLINEVKFNRDRKPELKKIGMDDLKEQKLLILAQFLVLHNHDSISKEDLTEKFIKFLETYQFKIVDMIFSSLDFLDISYEVFLPEIAKLEKKKIDEIINRDYLKQHITSPKIMENLIQNYLDIIRQKDREISELKERLKNENTQKNNILKDLDNLQFQFDEYKRNSNINKEKSNMRIAELQETIQILMSENEKNRNEKLKSHADDIKKIKDYYESVLERAKLDYQKQNENQKRDFDSLLNTLKNQNIELDKNQKNISNMVYKGNDFNLTERVKELEELLYKEKKINQSEREESNERINNLNLEYFNLSKIYENDQKKILEYESNRINLLNRLIEAEKENQRLINLLREKEDFILLINDDNLKERMVDKRKMELLSTNLQQRENELENLKRDFNSNENYKLYYDSYLNSKNEHDKVLFEKEGLENNYKYIQNQLNSTKVDLANALKNLKDKKDEYNKNFDRVNNLNINLTNELHEKNRKLELIRNQTEYLYEQLKPYPWGINTALNKPDVKNITIEKKTNLQNGKYINEMDSNSLKKQNDLNKKIENLSKENEKMKNRIINLYSQNGNMKIEEVTNEMEIPNNEKVQILSEKIKNKEITQIDFKDLDFINNDLFSLLLLNKANINQIRTWIYPLMNNFYTINNLNGPVRFNLLHKASINGFSSESFFKNCSNINNLLVVCLTNHGKLIGGFTPLKWFLQSGNEKTYINDNEMKSFVFSLSLNRKLPLVKSDFAILCCNSMGPVFGGGSDFEIVNNADKNLNNYANIGDSYNDGIEISAREFFGADNYLVQDYEVFQVNL
jgi:hypothetical protein